DVKVRMAVPIIKRRDATHRLRLAVRDGAIGFGEVEQQLALLENQILDFEVEGDELILEVDIIPIVKFDNVTLVRWALPDPYDRDLAGEKRVRLRRLLQYRLAERPARNTGDSGQGSVRLEELVLQDIGLDLSLGGPIELALGGGTVRLGAPDVAAVESFTARG